jgi:predicted patatin/cPLA2 family phospholipase
MVYFPLTIDGCIGWQEPGKEGRMDDELSKVRTEVRELIDTEQRLHDVIKQFASKETEGTVHWLTPPLESALTELELARDRLEAAYDRLGDAIPEGKDDL